jgi:hypothetical protein
MEQRPSHALYSAVGHRDRRGMLRMMSLCTSRGLKVAMIIVGIGVLAMGALFFLELNARVAVTPQPGLPSEPQSEVDVEVESGTSQPEQPLPEPQSAQVTGISTSPSTLSSSGWVTVTWNAPEDSITIGSGVYLCTQDANCHTSSATNLWIGVFFQSANLSTIGPQKWPTASPPWLKTSPVKWKPVLSASGTISFYLEQARENYFLALFANGSTYPTLLATCSVQFARLDKPMYVHIARTKKYDEILVMWQSLFTEPGLKVRTSMQLVAQNTCRLIMFSSLIFS